MRGAMPLMERYYDRVYGGIIGHPSPPLSADQWRAILDKAQAPEASPFVRSAIRGLRLVFLSVGAAATSVAIILMWRGDILTTVFAWLPSLFVGCLLLAAAFFMPLLVCVPITRLFHLKDLRRAASELGFAWICAECGYDCRSLPEDSVQCPECGAVAARPSTRAREQT